ncbi:hypothetical protein [Cellulosimicrobium protaetiae]|uniref:Uncharacterized protein n=1 Tax=Cellulosimicrobium protaetiae TaxID=2587808 RepID=A0A6M5UCQ6_9MICO|nr:hypothetical protein [Cellulosimicrobium protaetiae]QJW34985.1 hypothetical protein FIC82_000975 [Cellulosimicrobium protaetiae]
MRAWTPTTEMVRQLYVSGREARSPAETLRMHPDEIAAEFDRWLASLREPGARVATTREDDAS